MGRNGEAPESGARLTTKQAYRLQRKLQASLTRVLAVLMLFERSGQCLSPASAFMAASVSDLLASLIEPGSTLTEECFKGHPLGFFIEATKRRRKETKARQRRRIRQLEPLAKMAERLAHR
jgi:hypothetical protein